jgi:hypothetical protein
MSIEGYRSMAKNEDQLIKVHLQCNHYPPIPLSFVPVAKKAIKMAIKGCWDKTIKMPNKRKMNVAELVEAMHLETFLEG